MIIHVSPDGHDRAPCDQADCHLTGCGQAGSGPGVGTAEAPLRTIQCAAELARPGDTVRVHAGTYREWVRPVRGGLSDARRITFEAAEGEEVNILGSEVVWGWTPMGDGVWWVSRPNFFFGDFNPYAERVWGDWVIMGDAPAPHLGDVYLEGRSLYEVFDLADVRRPPRRETVTSRWTGLTTPHPDPAQTELVWYGEVGPDTTTIWANFGDTDPNLADVEINVRKSVFTPTDPHIDYVTVRGFRLGRAATPWAPPTAEQVGLIGPGWAKGWVIEDNLIFDSKCAGISLGKERGTGQNKSTVYGDKPGYQYQIEAVHDALDRGWSREQIGSHLVRRNVIRDCGQNGIVGHLGCVFSTIADNHIYRIGTKHEFFGAEIAGIKLHAPIDVQIVHNRIHDTTLGIWLDWQVQGARVTRNVLYRNTRDLFVEVCHGPTLIDHNLLASPIALELLSQGNALVGNLIAGSVRVQNVLDRATPYHRAHSTTVAGHAFTYAGDDRWYGNLFVGAPGGAYHPDLPLPMKQDDFPLETYGTEAYEGFPGSWEDYLARVAAAASPIDHVRFHFQRQAAYLGHNVYAGGARPASHEATAVVVAGPATARVSDDDDTVWLDLDLPSAVLEAVTPVTTGADLGHVRIAGLEFENPDGTPVRADIDLLGNWKTAPAAAGPLQYLATGPTKIWW